MTLTCENVVTVNVPPMFFLSKDSIKKSKKKKKHKHKDVCKTSSCDAQSVPKRGVFVIAVLCSQRSVCDDDCSVLSSRVSSRVLHAACCSAFLDPLSLISLLSVVLSELKTQ